MTLPGNCLTLYPQGLWVREVHTASISVKTHPGSSGPSRGGSGHSELGRNTGVASADQDSSGPVGRVRHLSVVGLVVGRSIDLLHGAGVTSSTALGHLLRAGGWCGDGTARKEHAASDGGEPHFGGGKRIEPVVQRKSAIRQKMDEDCLKRV